MKFTEVSRVKGDITTQNLVAAGAATAASAVEIDMRGSKMCAAQVTGTYTGALSAQVTVDGSTWVTLAAATAVTRMSTGVAAATITSAEQDVYQIQAEGVQKLRITGLAAMTGTATVTVATLPM